MQTNRPGWVLGAAALCTAQLAGAALYASEAPRRDDARMQRAQSAQTQQQTQSDAVQGVAAAVEDELAHDPFVSLDDIDVLYLGEGVVRLSGSVPTLIAKERAAHVVQTVRNVVQVDNQIIVHPRASPTAKELESAVYTALMANAATESFEVSVIGGPGGEVMLQGDVDSWAERALAERMAKSVTGVLSVQNQLDVSFTSTRTDIQIEADIQEMLQWDAYTHDGALKVNVRDGVVQLSGKVPSAAEKRRATTIAWVNGVRRVNYDKLEVDPSMLEGRQAGAAIEINDQNLEQAVRRALDNAAHASVRFLEVNVREGVATLRGVVGSLEEKRVANRTAQSVNGVLDVRDRLRVRDVSDEPLSDEAIEERVVSALVVNPITEAYKISVAVNNGVVMLTGDVGTQFERAAADDLAAGVRGVRNVENALQTTDRSRQLVFDPYVDARTAEEYDWTERPGGASPANDQAIISSIRRELEWSPYVDEEAVTLTVENGVATLRGTVANQAAVRAAAENAYEGGAREVVNELQVAGM